MVSFHFILFFVPVVTKIHQEKREKMSAHWEKKKRARCKKKNKRWKRKDKKRKRVKRVVVTRFVYFQGGKII